MIVGGGPTGVELAGAIGEMSRFTLARDFRKIDPKLTRVILIEAGPRILPRFAEPLASRAVRDLEQLGVQVWTDSAVTRIDADGVEVGARAHPRRDRAVGRGRAAVAARRARSAFRSIRRGACGSSPISRVPGHPEVFVIGDQACVIGTRRASRFPASPRSRCSRAATSRARSWAISPAVRAQPFAYVDKGQMATIGRSRAIVEIGRLRFAGLLAWLLWLVVHIYYLTGFKNRLLVVIQWAWSYLTFRRGARLIVGKHWRFYGAPRDGAP